MPASLCMTPEPRKISEMLSGCINGAYLGKKEEQRKSKCKKGGRDKIEEGEIT